MPKTPGGVSLREPVPYNASRYSARIRRLPVSVGLSAASSGTNSVVPSSPAAWDTTPEKAETLSNLVAQASGADKKTEFVPELTADSPTVVGSRLILAE